MKKPGSRPHRSLSLSEDPNPTSHCVQCNKALGPDDHALFVEEEVGRIFCSEDCILNYFTPDLERLEKEYFEHLPSDDLPVEERERLAHLRWATLQDPDEIWKEKTVQGDSRYTLISEFWLEDVRIYCVCISLMLGNEPSFLFQAFVTRSKEMVEAYRRGEQVKNRPSRERNRVAEYDTSASQTHGLVEDSLLPPTDPFVQSELVRDIPQEEYELYAECLEETVQQPDELWSIDAVNENQDHLLHFIREYEEEGGAPFWYVVVGREGQIEDNIEILEGFPTRSPEIVENYRKGEALSVDFEAEFEDDGRVVH